MKLDLKPFYDLVNKKYINVQKHDTADLLIWNYGQRCQFERYWTPETSMARGLITDSQGNIVARPFKKFFNLSEHIGEDTKLPPLPLEDFEVTEKYDGITDITKLTELAEDNKEGFVIRFSSGVRVKIKFEEYIRLHRLVTGVNARTIWDLLRNNQSFDELLDKVPDEYFEWVKKTKTNLEEEFKQIEDEAVYAFNQIKYLETRKEQALFLQEHSHYPGVVFKMIDKQPHQDLIWRMLRPVASKPYHQDIDAI